MPGHYVYYSYLFVKTVTVYCHCHCFRWFIKKAYKELPILLSRVSVRPSVRMFGSPYGVGRGWKLGSHRTDFRDISYLRWLLNVWHFFLYVRYKFRQMEVLKVKIWHSGTIDLISHPPIFYEISTRNSIYQSSTGCLLWATVTEIEATIRIFISNFLNLF